MDENEFIKLLLSVRSEINHIKKKNPLGISTQMKTFKTKIKPQNLVLLIVAQLASVIGSTHIEALDFKATYFLETSILFSYLLYSEYLMNYLLLGIYEFMINNVPISRAYDHVSKTMIHISRDERHHI